LLNRVVDLYLQYKEVADQARKVFAEYDPEFEAMSLDEAYLVILPLIFKA
jgi:nucleotidyltransferase/DNA polymerase involved in DNA repair